MLDILALIATAALFGGMIGFSFLFAPLVFAKLPAKTAANSSGRSSRGTTCVLPASERWPPWR